MRLRVAAALAGVAVAGLNVGVSALAAKAPGRLSARYGLVQAAAFFFRAATLFGVATAWWRRTRDAESVVLLLVVGAIAQMIAQVGLHLRGR